MSSIPIITILITYNGGAENAAPNRSRGSRRDIAHRSCVAAVSSFSVKGIYGTNIFANC